MNSITPSLNYSRRFIRRPPGRVLAAPLECGRRFILSRIQNGSSEQAIRNARKRTVGMRRFGALKKT